MQKEKYMKKKKIDWNKGMKKGDHPSLEKMGFQKGNKNPMKKEEIRERVSKILKKRCKRRSIYDIKTTSLIHRQVEKIITDYIRLCISCHRLYDFGKIKVKRSFKI